MDPRTDPADEIARIRAEAFAEDRSGPSVYASDKVRLLFARIDALAKANEELADALDAARTREAEAEAFAADNRMWKISKLIAELTSTQERFGDTCVYVRRGGMGWGAVALNRRDDDEKHGVFDLQAQHDRDMQQRAGQVERLIAAKQTAEAEREAAESRLSVLTADNAGLREALTRAERKLTAYVGVCSGDKELTDTVLPMTRTALAQAGKEPSDA